MWTQPDAQPTRDPHVQPTRDPHFLQPPPTTPHSARLNAGMPLRHIWKPIRKSGSSQSPWICLEFMI
jgi:hypothetical protein